MQIFGSVDNATPRSELAAHIPDFRAGVASDEDAVKDLVDKDLHGKEDSVLPFDLQSKSVRRSGTPSSRLVR